MTVVLSTLLLCATAVAVTVLLRPRAPQTKPQRSVLDDRLLDWVVLTEKSGTTFAGVLYAEDSGAVVLCKAEQFQPDGSRVPVDGEVVVLRGDIDFIQRP